MDGIVPVAAQIQPPDPQKGLGLLSSIIGIQQARQNLQTGQYQQQAVQAESEQAQQKNRELQAVGGLLKSVHGGGYRNADGTFNNQKFSDDVAAVAPVYGQDVATSAMSRANEVVRNQKAKQDLTDSARSSLGTMLTSLAKDPGTRRGDVIDAYQQWMMDHKDDPAAFRVGLAQAALLPQNDEDPRFRNVLGKYAATLTGQPTTAPTSVDTGATIQPGQTSNVTGAFVPTGPGIQKTLAPTEQLPYVRARGAAGTEGAQGASNDEQLYNQIVQSGAKATQLKSLTQDIQHLSQEVQTGQYSKAFADKWSALKQTFGFRPDDNSADTKRQILSKMAAQLKMQASDLGGTDAQREGITAALPDPEHMGPAAVGLAARYVGSQADIALARAKLANQHRQVNGGQSTGLRSSDLGFMSQADPRFFEYQGLPAGKARQDYLKQHFSSRTELEAFKKKADALKAYGVGDE